MATSSRWIRGSVGALGIALAAPLIAQHHAGSVAEGPLGAALADFVARSAAVGFSGAVLAARDGEVVVACAAGSADLEGEVPNTPSTLFEIASATKQFTAAALVKLHRAGKLDLDDSIAEHLPGVPEGCREITVRQLLQHTSGIPGTNSRGGGDDLAAVMPSFFAGGPQHEPGTHWEYWNQGYSLLSEVIARCSGDSYVEYCRRELFAPAEMRTACFTGDAAPEAARIAVGRSSRGEPRSALAHPYGSYGFQYRGMGGAVCSVWDLWRWDRALHGEEFIDAVGKAELFRPGLQNYALGWFVERDDERTVQRHGGGVRGFVCSVRRYPDDDGCLMVLCNDDRAPVRNVVRGLEELLFDEPSTVSPPPGPLSSDRRQALEGTYQDEQGRRLVVEVDGPVTRAQIHWGERGPVTRAYFGEAEAGALVLYEWTSVTPVTCSGADGARCDSVTIMDMTFRRPE